MADDKELFPGFNKQLDTAVHAAVTNAMADIDLVNLKRCREQLAEAVHDLTDVQARAEVWQEVATRRKDDITKLTEQIAELNTRVAFLESVIENMREAADDD